jgi:phosphohistidine phosphatase
MERMRIVLVRHGPAEPRDPVRWPDDLARPLTSRGESRMRRAAAGLARLERGIERVYTSPATRCVESARLLAAALGLRGEPARLDALAPGGAPVEALRPLARDHGNAAVALVGHEPELAEFAASLLGAAAGTLSFKKAGACALELVEDGRLAARLRWWLRPAALRAIKQVRRGKVA